MDELDNAGRWLAHVIAWLPDWAPGLIVLGLTLALALWLGGLVIGLAHRLLTGRGEFVQQLIDRVRGPVRLAILIFAVSAVLPVAPFDRAEVAAIRHGLLVGFVCLVGWSALVTIDLAAKIYLRQYRIDVEDNLLARKHFTQIRVLRRTISTVIVLITFSAALMTFEGVRQYGVSLLASAGAAGLVVGLAAQPVLSNLIAGIQLAVTQPIRIEDAVVVEGEWGWIEEITATYVVVRLWDWRRLIVPLKHFIEKPFQNWTREGASIIGTVLLQVDYTTPVEKVRGKLQEIAEKSPLWDRNVVNLQVVEAHQQTMELRALVSARSSPRAWDLRCHVREQLIAFLQESYPDALPRQRIELRDLPRLAAERDAAPAERTAPRSSAA